MTQEIITNELPIKGIKTGRKINPNSTRQKRLAEMKARAELNGGVIKRGRPAIALGISATVEIDVLGG
jgi:hypothetical protein